MTFTFTEILTFVHQGFIPRKIEGGTTNLNTTKVNTHHATLLIPTIHATMQTKVTLLLNTQLVTSIWQHLLKIVIMRHHQPGNWPWKELPVLKTKIKSATFKFTFSLFLLHKLLVSFIFIIGKSYQNVYIPFATCYLEIIHFILYFISQSLSKLCEFHCQRGRCLTSLKNLVNKTV